jgi:hypothetical protein
MNGGDAELLFQVLRDEVASISVFSTTLQEQLKEVGADAGTPQTHDLEEVRVHAMALGANLSSLDKFFVAN